jgi:uncharacterized protein with NRDE domain
MCTLILLRRPDHDWPLLLAANRDEMTDRPWRPPARHWRDQPDVTAGMDLLAGGSWLGLSDAGMVAAIMNRRDTLGPQAGKHSRGQLVLKSLQYTHAAAAAAALGADLDPAWYRSFNLVVADRLAAFWICHRGDDGPGRIETHRLPPGLTMLTDADPNDARSPRIRDYLPRFRCASAPDPEAEHGWSAWTDLLASRRCDAAGDPGSAMTVVTDRGFGTSSSSLVALPAVRGTELRPIWLFAPGRPDQTPYQPITL